jgi:SH3-like domain-containing protein
MNRIARAARWCLALLLALCGTLAHGLEFRSVRAPGAVIYDSPSLQGRKLHILTTGYPVEIVVTTEGWYKVRDATGALAWIESARLSEERNVMVYVARATVRRDPQDDSPGVFDAEQGVLFKLVEPANGWLKVRHRDGTTGYIRLNQVWGG